MLLHLTGSSYCTVHSSSLRSVCSHISAQGPHFSNSQKLQLNILRVKHIWSFFQQRIMDILLTLLILSRYSKNFRIQQSFHAPDKSENNTLASKRFNGLKRYFFLGLLHSQQLTVPPPPNLTATVLEKCVLHCRKKKT